ncbi:MAG: 16S rRNA (guanine(966)-N(2))-methyltransferase RsmD [bacterium JZ-2024 1]
MKGGEILRVSGGRWKKSRLFAGPTGKVRATTQLVRSSVFNILQDRIVGARFLDLFAGTGAVGIEALSRGANEIVFVESNPLNAAIIRRNLEKFRVTARVMARPANLALALLSSEGAPFNVIFLDPPYNEPFHCPLTLEYLAVSPLIAPGSVVVVQAHKSLWLRDHYGPLTLRKRYRYGTTHLWVYDFREDAEGTEARETVETLEK